MMKKISFAVTTYNRFEFTVECIDNIINDERIGEIICSDDCSTDGSFELLKFYYSNKPKVKMFQNDKNVDCYKCKYLTVGRCSFDYCIIADSDNLFYKDYLDKIFEQDWDENTILMPSFAKPQFNYRAYSGVTLVKENLKEYIDKPLLETCLNCMNYFVNVKNYLEVWDGSVDPVTSDSLYQNYNWIISGKKFKIVDGLEYEHRIHENSHYINNVVRTGDFREVIMGKIRNLS